MKYKIKIYVGCSLTHAPEEFITAVEKLKKRLRADYEVYDFLGLDTGLPRDVYQWDIHRCVAACDLFVAICDYASLGLGYELGAAIESFNKPVLAVAHRKAPVTRLIQGITVSNFSFKRYELFTDIDELIQRTLMARDALQC